MSDGDAALQQMIDRFARLERFAADVATEAAPLVEQASRATAAAGTDPEGASWPSRKKDGGRALANAADGVTATASGTVVTIRLRAPEIFHQHGVGKHTPKRKVIPDTGDPIPPGVAEACRTAAANVFARAMGGGR